MIIFVVLRVNINEIACLKRYFVFIGLCRQYVPHAKPCGIHEIDYESIDNNSDDDNTGRCGENEECLPPSDRAKHGYCQCKLGFIRKDDHRKCVADNRESLSTNFLTSTKSTLISSLFDIEVDAGDDQTIILPTNQVDLFGHVLYKSNKSEVDMSELNKRKLNLFWSLKSSTNETKVDISTQEGLASHAFVKQLRKGIYEFQLKLNDKNGQTLASDVTKIELLSGIRLNAKILKFNLQLFMYPNMLKRIEIFSEYES